MRLRLFALFVLLGMFALGASVHAGKKQAVKQIKTSKKWSLKKHRYSIKELSVSRDKKRLLVRSYRRWVTWDLVTHKKVGLFSAKGWFNSVELSPKGLSLAALKGYFRPKLRFWDLSGKSLGFVSLSFKARKLRFLTEQTFVVLGQKKLAIIDRKGAISSQIAGRFQRSSLFLFHRQGLILVGGTKTLSLYTWKGGLKKLGSFALSSPLTAAVVSKKTLFVGMKNGAIRSFSKGKGGKFKASQSFVGHTSKIKALWLVKDSLVAFDSDRHIVFWKPSTAQILHIQKTSWGSRFAQWSGERFFQAKWKNLGTLSLRLPPSAKPFRSDALGMQISDAKLVALAWLPSSSAGRGFFASSPIRRMAVADKKGRIFEVSFQPQQKKIFSIKPLFKVRRKVLALSTDAKGQRLAAVGYLQPRSINIWSFRTKKIRKLSVAFKVNSLSFTEEGRTLWVGSQRGDLVSFNLMTGKISKRIRGHQNISSLHRAGPKGQFLMVNGGFRGKVIVVYKSATGETLRFQQQTANITDADIEPSGRWAITGVNGGAVRIWDLQKGKKFKKVWTKSTGAIAIDPKRRFFVSAVKSGFLNFYSLHTGKLLKRKRGYWSKPSALSVAPDGGVVAGFLGSRLLLFTTPSFQAKTLDGKPLALKPFRFSLKTTYLASLERSIRDLLIVGKKKKFIIVANRYGAIFALDLLSKKKVLLRKRQWSSGLGSLAMTKDSSFFYGLGKKKRIVRMQAKTWAKTYFPIHMKKRKSFAVSQDGRWFAIGNGRGRLSVFEFSHGSLTKRYTFTVKGRYRFRGLAFQPGGVLLAAGNDDNLVRTWSLSTGQLIWKAKRGDDVNEVKYHPSGKELAIIDENGQVAVFESKSGKMLKNYVIGNIFLDGYTLSYRSDGRILAAGFEDGVVALIDRKTHRVWKPKAWWQDIRVIRWTSDHRLLVAYEKNLFIGETPKDLPAAGKAVKAPRTPSIKVTATTSVTKKPVSATKKPIFVPNPRVNTKIKPSSKGKVVFHGTHRLLVLGRAHRLISYISGNKVIVRRIKTGRLLKSFVSPFSAVRRLRLDPFGRFVAISNLERNRIVYWNLRSGVRMVLGNVGSFYSFRIEGAYILLERVGGKKSLVWIGR